MRPDLDPLDVELLERTHTERANLDRARLGAGYAQRSRDRWQAAHGYESPDDASASPIRGITNVLKWPIRIIALAPVALAVYVEVATSMGARP